MWVEAFVDEGAELSVFVFNRGDFLDISEISTELRTKASGFPALCLPLPPQCLNLQLVKGFAILPLKIFSFIY